MRKINALLNVHFLFSWMMVSTLSLSLICCLWRFYFWVDVIFIYFWGGYVTFSEDCLEIVDTGNSSVSHLSTKMQKKCVRISIRFCYILELVGSESISEVRKLISTYHCLSLSLIEINIKISSLFSPRNGA